MHEVHRKKVLRTGSAHSKELNMNIRNKLLTLTVALAAVPAAFAGNFVGGELGYETHPVNSASSREQVRREYLEFRTHPVLADGTVVLQGEAGYVPPVQGAFADREPAGPHTHVLGNAAAITPKVAPALTEAEQRAYREQYVN
jgi:hypothetical protein